MLKKKSFTVEQIKRKLEHYCAYQDRCHKEVEQKMWEFTLIPEAKELILLHLMEHDFLNEERFAKSYARGKFRIKKYGRVRITRELKRRDISAYNIKTALKEIEEEEYVATIYHLVEKKIDSINESNTFKKKKKIIDHLLYKGYENSLIYSTVNELIEM